MHHYRRITIKLTSHKLQKTKKMYRSWKIQLQELSSIPVPPGTIISPKTVRKDRTQESSNSLNLLVSFQSNRNPMQKPQRHHNHTQKTTEHKWSKDSMKTKLPNKITISIPGLNKTLKHTNSPILTVWMNQDARNSENVGSHKQLEFKWCNTDIIKWNSTNTMKLLIITRPSWELRQKMAKSMVWTLEFSTISIPFHLQLKKEMHLSRAKRTKSV